MAPSRVLAGGNHQSPSSSGVVFHKNGQSQGVINSHLVPPYGKSNNSILGSQYSTLGQISGDVNNVVWNSVANSGSTVGASSLVTDENSLLSFSPNNVSGSPGVDGSSLSQQGSQQIQSSQMHQEHQSHGALNATSLSSPQAGQVSLPTAENLSSAAITQHDVLPQVQKKQCLDIKQENAMHQPIMQKRLGENPLHMQGHNPKLQPLLQEQKPRQQNQQVLQSMPHVQRAQQQQQHQKYQQQLQQHHLHQQQHHLHQQQHQFRHHMQQGIQQSQAVMKPPSGEGVCSRRLMQYLYHQRQRPAGNSIAYWRKFVDAYYSPHAKKRWCLSLYRNVGENALGVFSEAAKDAWRCDICRCNSGRGFEATFEVLPRLSEIKFGSGVIDELLYLDLPRESRFDSGIMTLEYQKAVLETVYDKIRVVREGHLRIIFARDLKILSWEFCARGHEELLSMRPVAPKVNEMVQAALKCQKTIAESGSDGVSQENLETNSNMVVTAGRELAKTLELQSLNDLGFSKRYVRSLQISEVVSSMKDLIDFSLRHKAGPIESLKNYPRHASAAKLQLQKMQELQQFANVQGLPTDRTTLNKLMMAMHSGVNSPMNRGAFSASAQAALALSNYQNMLRQNSINSNVGSLQHEVSSSFNNSNQCPYSTSQNIPVNTFSNTHLPTEQQQRLPNSTDSLQQSQSLHSQGNQAVKHHLIQQHLNQMNNNSFIGQNVNGNLGSTSGSAPNISGGVADLTPIRSNSFKAATNGDTPADGGYNNGSNQNGQNLHLSEDNVEESYFNVNGFFDSELEDNISFEWKQSLNSLLFYNFS